MTREEKHEIFDELHRQIHEVKFLYKMISAKKGGYNEYLPVAYEMISTIRMIGINYFIRGFIVKEDAEVLLNEYVSFFNHITNNGYFVSKKHIWVIERGIEKNRRTLEEKQ